ncbi:MAG: hypothetical protein ABIE36_03040 [Candidatus Diapherotrites archaeon]
MKIKKNILLSLILGTMLLVSVTGMVSASPTIDGVISSGEWDGATIIDVANGMGTVSVIVDTDYIHVLFDVVDSTDARLGQNQVGNDKIGLNINPGLGAWGKPYDLVFQTGADPAAFTTTLPTGVSSGMSDGWYTEWVINGIQLTLPSDVETKTIYTGNNRISEWKFPVSSQCGDILKIGGACDNLADGGGSFSYPPSLSWSDPIATFKEIEITCPPCELIITDPTANDWFDSEAVEIKWTLSEGCTPIDYFDIWYEKDGDCNPDSGSWFDVAYHLAPGVVQNPIFPNYHYLWDRPLESGQYCVKVKVSSNGARDVSEQFNVDLAPPEVSLSVGTPKVGECAEGETGDCYVNQDTEITLTCADNNPSAPWQSGVDKIEYRYSVDGGEFTAWLTYNGAFKFPEDTNHLLEYRCFDNVGKVDSESKAFIVDTVAPTITRTVGEPKICNGESECDLYVATTTEICVTSIDPQPHPVDDVQLICEYYWGDDPQELYPGHGVYQVDLGVGGTGCFYYAEDSYHTLTCRATDALGNTNESVWFDIVDAKAPNTDLGYTEPLYATQTSVWINTATEVVLTGTDSEPHPVGGVTTHYRYKIVDEMYCLERQSQEIIDLIDWGEIIFQIYTEPFGIPEESCHAIEYYSVDVLGNEELHKYEFVFADHTPPVLNKEVGKPSHECTELDLFDVCEDSWDWKVTMATPIYLSCVDSQPHPSGVKELCYRILWEGEEIEQWTCAQEDHVTVTFQEECEHTLEFYCVDNVGKTSETDSEVFKVEGTSFEIDLDKKWNLISVPVNLLSTDVEEVFSDISENIEGVWSYEDGEWKVYKPGVIDGLTKIVPGRGYWVKTSKATSLLIGGSLMSPGPTLPPSIPLDKGWNLIGRYGLAVDQPAYCALFSLVDTTIGHPRWSALFGYKSGAFVPLNTGSLTHPGEGYWIEMDVKDSYSTSSVCYGFP